MNNLPRDLQYQLLLTLSGPDILNLCNTNTTFKQYCSSNRLWLDKLSIEFPGEQVPRGMSPSQFYMQLYKNIITKVAVTVDINGEKTKIGDIWQHNYNTLGKAYYTAEELLKSKGYNRYYPLLLLIKFVMPDTATGDETLPQGLSMLRNTNTNKNKTLIVGTFANYLPKFYFNTYNKTQATRTRINPIAKLMELSGVISEIEFILENETDTLDNYNLNITAINKEDIPADLKYSKMEYVD